MVASLMALVTAGFVWPADARAATPNPWLYFYQHSVYMAGDSLTCGTEPYMQFLFDIAKPPRDLSVDAYPGVTLSGVGTTWFQHARNNPPMPPTAVIALGGNDSDAEVNSGAFPWYVWGAIETLTNPMPNSPPVNHIYWINFYSQSPTYPGNNRQNNITKNAQLEWAVSFFASKVTVLDWASYIAQHPGWVLPDGVHYTPAGYAARALWINQHIPS